MQIILAALYIASHGGLLARQLHMSHDNAYCAYNEG